MAFASLVRELFDFFPLLLEAGAVDFRIQLAQAPEFLAFLHPQEQFLVFPEYGTASLRLMRGAQLLVLGRKK